MDRPTTSPTEAAATRAAEPAQPGSVTLIDEGDMLLLQMRWPGIKPMDLRIPREGGLEWLAAALAKDADLAKLTALQPADASLWIGDVPGGTPGALLDVTTWHCVHQDCGERHVVEDLGVDPEAPVRLRAVLQDHADKTHSGETRWPCTFVLTYPGGSTSVAYATARTTAS